jgi:glycosyltransferase involved in cell wall biosynthesis
MAPDEIEWHKLGRTDDVGQIAEERTAAEVTLGRTAHRLAAVGPILYDRYLTELSAFDLAAKVLRLDPGFDGSSATHRCPPPGSPWRILVLGRTEDAHLKGLDLAAAAVGSVLQERGDSVTPIELIVRGAPPGTAESLHTKLRDWSRSPSLTVVVRPYSDETDRLVGDLRIASLALMPSRAEGFGLVGAEAIAAGTPVLVSAGSGLGRLLRESLPPDDARRFVVPMSGNAAQDAASWAREIGAVLRDRDAAFDRADELRRSLSQRCSWATVAQTLLESIDDVTAESRD